MLVKKGGGALWRLLTDMLPPPRREEAWPVCRRGAALAPRVGAEQNGAHAAQQEVEERDVHGRLAAPVGRRPQPRHAEGGAALDLEEENHEFTGSSTGGVSREEARVHVGEEGRGLPPGPECGPWRTTDARGRLLLTRGVLHQEAGGVAPLHLAALQQVHGQELALGGVDLEVTRGQREDEHGGDEHQEQGQAAGGGGRR
ncbi:hypothetical protein EYF80_055959 [Liparis tanakae]|uniref:Uncharacterized protein n=1 Tax=Liparis tanakae TaxID=230148 RepID=A0A4Z2EY31_9TELE|nr:hypothetical protein EYF80_055959 [Liparis tanakae]